MPRLPSRDAVLILASASTGRAAVLRDAGLPFRQIPAAVDERAIEAEVVAADGRTFAESVALRLAECKALAISRQQPDAIVIGADQLMACGDELIHKPLDLAEARRQLEGLRGREHGLVSGQAIAIGGEVVWRHLGVARLEMRGFSDAFLDDYIATEGGALLGGVYRIEGPGIQLFTRVDGDHFTIIGLPLLPLLGYLRQIGWLQS